MRLWHAIYKYLLPLFSGVNCPSLYDGYAQGVCVGFIQSNNNYDLTNRHARFPLSSDVLEADVWKSQSHLTSPYLVDLARTLPDVVLASLKAPGTLDKYHLAWLGWKRWAARFPCVSPSAQPLHVALYFKDLLKTAKSIAPIAAAQYGIRWAHHVAGVQSPTDHTMVQSTMEGCRRLLAKPVQPKDPLPAHVFPKIVRAPGGPDVDIDNLRLLVLVLVGYAGFMRISELLKVKYQDVEFHDTHMSIRVPKRKNDQYRQGHVVNISRTGNPTCPVAMTERLAAKAQFAHGSHLVCRYFRSKAGLRASASGISYTRALEILKAGLKPFLGDKFNLGSHSLKSGAATAVASSAQVDSDAIDKHADMLRTLWTKKLLVSGSLGL